MVCSSSSFQSWLESGTEVVHNGLSRHNCRSTWAVPCKSHRRRCSRSCPVSQAAEDMSYDAEKNETTPLQPGKLKCLELHAPCCHRTWAPVGKRLHQEWPTQPTLDREKLTINLPKLTLTAAQPPNSVLHVNSGSIGTCSARRVVLNTSTKDSFHRRKIPPRVDMFTWM